MSAQHSATRDVVEAIPVTELRWTLLAISRMHPTNPKQGLFESLQEPCSHNLVAGATAPPEWEDTWVGKIPWIGPYLSWPYMLAFVYDTKLEAVADFLAEDLEKGDGKWVGKKVAVKEKAVKKNV